MAYFKEEHFGNSGHEGDLHMGLQKGMKGCKILRTPAYCEMGGRWRSGHIDLVSNDLVSTTTGSIFDLRHKKYTESQFFSLFDVF